MHRGKDASNLQITILVILVLLSSALAGKVRTSKIDTLRTPSRGRIVYEYGGPSGSGYSDGGLFSVSWDSKGNEIVTEVAWGELYPGDIIEKTIWLKLQNMESQTFELSTSKWSPPEAQNFITLSWDYDGTPVTHSEPRPVKITISISEKIKDIYDFSFDIIITSFTVTPNN